MVSAVNCLTLHHVVFPWLLTPETERGPAPFLKAQNPLTPGLSTSQLLFFISCSQRTGKHVTHGALLFEKVGCWCVSTMSDRAIMSVNVLEHDRMTGCDWKFALCAKKRPGSTAGTSPWPLPRALAATPHFAANPFVACFWSRSSCEESPSSLDMGSGPETQPWRKATEPVPE